MAPYKKEVKRDALVARENGESAIKIASTPGSIGYIGMSFGKIVEEYGGKILSVDGVAPSNETISDGSYPLTNDFYVVIRKSAEKDSPERILYNWICSEQGRELVEKENYPVKATS